MTLTPRHTLYSLDLDGPLTDSIHETLEALWFVEQSERKNVTYYTRSDGLRLATEDGLSGGVMSVRLAGLTANSAYNVMFDGDTPARVLAAAVNAAAIGTENHRATHLARVEAEYAAAVEQAAALRAAALRDLGVTPDPKD